MHDDPKELEVFLRAIFDAKYVPPFVSRIRIN
jgi:hypothetical protein